MVVISIYDSFEEPYSNMGPFLSRVRLEKMLFLMSSKKKI
jgi:hypothetical protein